MQNLYKTFSIILNMETLDEIYRNARVDEQVSPLRKVEVLCDYLQSQTDKRIPTFHIINPDGSLKPESGFASEQDVLDSAEKLYYELVA